MKVKEYAKKHNVHPNTVSLWAYRGLIECTYKYRGKKKKAYIADINENSPPPHLKSGPRPIKDVKINDEPPWDQVTIDQAIKELEAK